MRNVHLAEARRSFFVLTHKERNDLEGPWGENALGTTLEPQLVSRGISVSQKKATLVVGGLLGVESRTTHLTDGNSHFHIRVQQSLS